MNTAPDPSVTLLASRLVPVSAGCVFIGHDWIQVQMGHSHLPEGTVARGGLRQSRCQPALHLSHSSILSSSYGLWQTWHCASSAGLWKQDSITALGNALALFFSVKAQTLDLLLSLKLGALRRAIGCRMRSEEHAFSVAKERLRLSHLAALAAAFFLTAMQDEHEYLEASQQTGHTTGDECARGVSILCTHMPLPTAFTTHILSRSFSSAGLRGSWTCWASFIAIATASSTCRVTCAAITALSTYVALSTDELVYAAALTHSGNKLTHTSAKVGATT